MHINEIRKILVDNIICEDNVIRLKNKLKYDLYNLLLEQDYEFMQELHKKLEYDALGDE